MGHMTRNVTGLIVSAIVVLLLKGHYSPQQQSHGFIEAEQAVNLVHSGAWERTLRDVVPWELVDSGFLYSTRVGSAGARSLDDCGKADRDDLDDALYYALRALEREGSGAAPAIGLHVRRVWAAYRRSHRALGVSYLLDLETNEDTSGNAVHRVAVHRGFDGKGGVRRFAERRAEREQGVFVVVYVLSLAEVASLQELLRSLDEAVSTEKCSVCVSYAPDLDMSSVASHGQCKLHTVSVKEGSDPWKACTTKASDGAVLAFVAPDMAVRCGFLERCRRNVVAHAQVFSPIVYALYPGASGVGWYRGYWAEGEYTALCIHASDYQALVSAGALVPTSPRDVLHAALQDGYSVMRAYEPGLVQPWQRVLCTDETCLPGYLQRLGSQRRLAEIVWERQIPVPGTV